MDINYVERNVKATLEHEGQKPSETGQSITHLYLLGKIDSNQAIQMIKNHHLVKGGVSNG